MIYHNFNGKKIEDTRRLMSSHDGRALLSPFLTFDVASICLKNSFLLILFWKWGIYCDDPTGCRCQVVPDVYAVQGRWSRRGRLLIAVLCTVLQNLRLCLLEHEIQHKSVIGWEIKMLNIEITITFLSHIIFL